MNKANVIKQQEIKKEVKNITLEMVMSDCWLDGDTWINWAIKWTDNLRELFEGFFEFDNGATEEEQDYWICIEYWKDEDKIVYLLQCDNDTINISDMIACEYIDNLVMEAVRLSK